jgi:hypothetical protein
MQTTKQGKLSIEVKYDPARCRHYVNGETAVLHCHHYASLYTQIADDATLFDGRTILRETSEESFYRVLNDLMSRNDMTSISGRISAVEDYWSFCGMGSLSITKCDASGGRAEMVRSHIDEGWIKKWGKRNEPVNFITQGYLSAAFSVVHGAPRGTYGVTEEQSIVSGAEKSTFSISRK